MMEFISKYRGPDFCPYCGEELRWVRLVSGMWAAVQVDPVRYVPYAGRATLIDSRWDGSRVRGCLIYRGGRGIDTSKLKTGYEEHVYRCYRRGEWKRKEQQNGR
jgi:hypothetical protein